MLKVRSLRTVLYFLVALGVTGIVSLVAAEAVIRFTLETETAPNDGHGYTRETVEYPDLPQEFVTLRLNAARGALQFTADQTLYGCRHLDAPDALRIAQGKVEALFLGDSFTYGWGVANAETFAAAFARAAGLETRTLACGGYMRGLRYHIEQLQRVLRSEPNIKVVFYQVFGNDLTQDHWHEPTGASAGQRPRPWHSRLKGWVGDLFPGVTHYLLWPAYRTLQAGMGAYRSYESEPGYTFEQYGAVLKPSILSARDRQRLARDLSLYRRDVAHLLGLAKQAGITVVPFLIPYGGLVEPETAKTVFVNVQDDVDADSLLAYRRFVAETFEAAGLSLVDFHEVIAEHKAEHGNAPLYLQGDLHLTPRGNEVVGRYLAGLYRSLVSSKAAAD